MPVGGTGYQHSLSEIREMVYALLMQDSTNTHWKEARLNAFINRALDDVRGAGVETVGYNSFTTTAGNQTQAMPANVLAVLNVTYDDEALHEITIDDMDRITGGDWDAGSGIPQFWFVEYTDSNPVLRFDVEFSESGKTVEYWYLKRTQDLTADGDLSGFFKSFTSPIVYRTMTLAMEADRKDGSSWDKLYQETLMDAQFNARQRRLAAQMHDPYGGS